VVTKRYYHSKRFAFTMIELIFAIVIIAIAVLSLPIMSGVNQKAIEDSIVQEAIFAASAELMDASAGYWDEYSMQDANISKFSRVINISATSPCNATTKLRSGHIAQPYHRRCLDDTTIVNAYTGGTGSIPDLSDLAHANQQIFIGGSSDASGYKQMYKSDLNISLAVNEVKTLTSTIKDESGTNILVKLKLQSANIGEVDYYKRTF